MEPKELITINSDAELFLFLDRECSTLNKDRNLISYLESTTVPDELADVVRVERTALGFGFDGCEPKQEWSATSTTGEVIGSPSPKDLTQAAFEYFIQRFEQTNNPYLKARYGLVLWNGPRGVKNIRFLQSSLDNLLEALEKAECHDKDGLRNCIDVLEISCSIATTAKYKQEETVAALLNRFTNEVPFERHGRNQLLSIISRNMKLFRSRTNDILATIRMLFEENFEAEDYFNCQNNAKLAAPIAQGSKLDVQEWHYREGRACEGIAEKRLSDNSSLVSMQFYTLAAQAYQMAGDEAAQQQALLKAQNLKNDLRLGTVAVPLPEDYSKMLQEDINQATDNLLAQESDVIFYYLSYSPEIVPDFDLVKQHAQQAGSSFLDYLSVVNIDMNRNFQRETSEPIDGIPIDSFIQAYKINFAIRLQYLFPIFIEGYRKGKISFPSLASYLGKNSWAVKIFTELDFQGNTIEYTWEPLLFPAFEDFFNQLQVLVEQNPVCQFNFVLCIDSLTVKVEGLMRELLQRTGNSTIATHRESDLREVYFDDLLQMVRNNNLMSESEFYFFRYVFTPFGRNQRNAIAHSYFHLSKDYSLGSIILVFCAVLRLIRLIPSPQTEQVE